MENYDCFLSATFLGLKRQACLESLFCLSCGFKSASGAASEAEGRYSQVAEKDTFMLRASPGTRAASTPSWWPLTCFTTLWQSFYEPVREKVKNKRSSMVYADEPKSDNLCICEFFGGGSHLKIQRMRPRTTYFRREGIQEKTPKAPWQTR